MAEHTVLRSVHADTTADASDDVNLVQRWSRIEVTNRGATNPLYVTFDGSTPEAEADDSTYVGAGDTVTSLAFSVEGVTATYSGNETKVRHRVRIAADADVPFSIEGLT